MNYGDSLLNALNSIHPLIIEKTAQLAASARVFGLSERLGFDLADAFAGHRELLAHFLQRVVGVHA